jgi:replication factor C subunit 1
LLLGGESPSPPPLFFTDSIFRWLFAAVDFPGIEGKVKAAFTRAYNKEAHMTPYAAGQVKKGRSKDTADDLEALDGDEDGLAGEVDDEEQSEDPSLDAMIKVKKESKKTASSSGAAAAGAAGRKKTGAPAATRGRGGGRGGRKKAAE